MINVKGLKLKKIFNLKEYLQERARLDREYEEYVKASMKRAEEDITAGRYYTLEELKQELKKDVEEFEMMRNE